MVFNIEPRIEILPLKRMIGNRCMMSLVNTMTRDLWQRFMLRRKEIVNPMDSNLYSISVYDHDYFQDFNPNNEYEKWAAVEVNNFESIPEGFDSLILQKGLYAVFSYQGLSTDHSIFEYIYTIWLPKSNYRLDHRPHFEILGEKYRNNDPNSEEEIWIPIKPLNIQ